MNGIFIIICLGLMAMNCSCASDLKYKCSKSKIEYVYTDNGIALHVDRDGRPQICPDEPAAK